MLGSVCSRENYIPLLGYLLIFLEGVTVNETRPNILLLKQIHQLFVFSRHALLEKIEIIVFLS